MTCLVEIIAVGVDGTDLREENHCTHTNEPEAYGFNPVVLERCRPDHDLLSEVARVRGEAYIDFLCQAHMLLSAHGVRLRYHLNMDYFRPDPPSCSTLAYPANLHFDWPRWLADGLCDETVLRSYQHRTAMLTDPFGADLVAASRCHDLPISFNHHIFADESWYPEEARRVAVDGRFAGLLLYEAKSFLHPAPAGECSFTLPVVEQIYRELGAQ